MRTKIFFSFLFSLCLLLPAVSSAQVISGGGYHSLYVCLDSTAQTWGWNIFGQLGNGTTISNSIPLPVILPAGITAVAGGVYHSLFLRNDSTVWTSGFNL